MLGEERRVRKELGGWVLSSFKKELGGWVVSRELKDWTARSGLLPLCCSNSSIVTQHCSQPF